MAETRRYLIIMEVESDMDLTYNDTPSSPRWRYLDVYPCPNEENYRAEGSEIDLVEILSVKDMGEAEEE